MNSQQTLAVNSRYLLMALLVYFGSRIVLATLGLHFDMEPLQYFWQYLDPKLLTENLLTSVFYQHSQPPLFNLFLGWIIKLFPLYHPWVFSAFFHGCSLVIYILMYYLLAAHQIKPIWAFAFATFFILMPEAILYEKMLFYTWPAAAFLMLAAFFLHRFDTSKKPTYVIGFLITLTLICLFRSMFHLFFLVACSVLLLLFCKAHRKVISLASLISILLVGSVYTKNLVVFDFFGASSWTGMNVWRIVNAVDSAADSTASPLAKIPPFSPLEHYPEQYQVKAPPSLANITALTTQTKSNGEPNYNHFAYIQLSNEYLTLSKAHVKQNPTQYLTNIARAWINYSEPAWKYKLLLPNYQKLEPYVKVVGLHKPLYFIEHKLFKMKQNKYIFSAPHMSRLPVIFALLIIGISALKQLHENTFARKPVEGKLMIYFMWLTIGYIAVLGNALEYGENNRFRVQTDPLIIIAFVIGSHRIWRQLAR